MVLEEEIIKGDMKLAWREIESLFRKGQWKKIHSRLTFIVGRYFWWLSGEWYDVTGKMGWSPGFRDWDIFDGAYPPPLANGKMYLKWFVSDLCTTKPSTDIDYLIVESEYGDLQSVEAELYREVSERVGKLEGTEAIMKLYDLSARRGLPDYMLGAARPFLWLVFSKKWWRIGLAGLIFLQTRGLSKKDAIWRKLKEKR